MSSQVIAALMLMMGTLLFSAGVAVIPAKVGDAQTVITANSPVLGALVSPTTMTFLLAVMGITSGCFVLWRLFSRQGRGA